MGTKRIKATETRFVRTERLPQNIGGRVRVQRVRTLRTGRVQVVVDLMNGRRVDQEGGLGEKGEPVSLRVGQVAATA